MTIFFAEGYFRLDNSTDSGAKGKKPPMLMINIIQSPKTLGPDLVLASNSCGFPVKVFPTIADFLPNASGAIGCVLVHFESLREFEEKYNLHDSFFQYFKMYSSTLPVVVAVSEKQVSDVVKLVRDGAFGVIDCKQPISKFCMEITTAMESNQEKKEVDSEVQEALQSFSKLNENEKNVLACYLAGYQAKQTASLLEIGRRTVDNRKNSFMGKFSASSFPQLIRKVMLVEFHTGVKISDRVKRIVARKTDPLGNATAVEGQYVTNNDAGML